MSDEAAAKAFRREIDLGIRWREPKEPREPLLVVVFPDQAQRAAEVLGLIPEG